MATIAAFCPLSLQALFDASGMLIVGARIYVYNAQTTTSRSAYMDSALASPHPSPVKTDAFGRIPKIYLGTGSYRIVLQDNAGALITDVDDLPGGTVVADTTISTNGWNTGDVKGSHTTDIQDGWLVLNGNTIGSQYSSGTARANADTQDLFVKLWNNDTTLVVSGGRGASATADFVAGKTIALPDYRGRFFVGVDQMGGPATAGVISTFTTTTPDTIGTRFGTESVTLSVGQLPTFTPTVTIIPAGAHNHGASSDVQGGHTHGGSTNQSGDHAHTYQLPNIDNGVSGGLYGRANGTSAAATSAAGNHTHSITTDFQGSHAHNISVSGVGDHTHTATASPIGGGGAHSNMPPAVMGFWHIRL